VLRQGDVLLVRVDELPQYCHPVPRRGPIVLAEGEATGHAHVITATHATLHVTGGDDAYLVVTGGRSALLRHEEHDTIAVAPGVWEVRRQREYSPRRETLWVAD